MKKLIFLMVCVLVGVGVFYMVFKQKKDSDAYVQHGDLKLWAQEFGDKNKPALLLVSGAMASARVWSDAFCKQIADSGFYVIRFDPRDMGLSSGVDYEKSPYDVYDLADDARAVLDHFEIKKAYVAGISMGGSIAQVLSLQHPDRCAGIILISSPAPGVVLSPKEEEILKETWKVFDQSAPTLSYEESLPNFLKSYRYLSGSLPFDESMAKDYVKDMYERSNHMYLTADNQVKQFMVPHPHVIAQQRNNIQEDDLARIDVPTLIIHGEKDPIVLPVNARAAAQKIKNAQLVIISGMGHMIFNRDLEKKITEIIVDFLRKV